MDKVGGKLRVLLSSKLRFERLEYVVFLAVRVLDEEVDGLLEFCKWDVRRSTFPKAPALVKSPQCDWPRSLSFRNVLGAKSGSSILVQSTEYNTFSSCSCSSRNSFDSLLKSGFCSRTL